MAHADHADLADILDLDAEVLRDHHDDVIRWVASLTPAGARIIDLGAGTGAAALALARHVPGAEVTAVDMDESMLDRLRAKARALGLDGRVTAVRADLDQPWPALGPAGLIWAANSLHHVADPAGALARALAALRPGGLVAVSEMSAFPRFLPDPAGAALEERARAVMTQLRREAGMHLDEHWGARLAGAGFTVAAERRFDVALRPPLPPAAGRYARAWLGRVRDGVDGRLSPADLASLDAIVAGVADRDDLTVTASRTVWIGRRPG
jgi:SAM-dependent methyltransferase